MVCLEWIAYNNVAMSSNGLGVLYDLGVVVGHDKAKGVWDISSGWDSFCIYLLNAFLFG